MQIELFAVGRMKAGAERDLTERYWSRFSKAAPALGMSAGRILEIAESRGATASARQAEESAKLLQFGGDDAALIVLDERGKTLDSMGFSRQLANWRDGGKRRAVIALGGPDGHDSAAREAADLMLNLGSMTWPHQIARILICEQLYRAVTILSGHPYHRV